jgi:cytoskeletal protein CcmA (bactofilin family)
MNPQSRHRPAAPPAERTVLSVIPLGASFQGILAWRGAVRVEGSLEGDAVAQGALEIGPEARVNGNVLVDELVVAGTLEGDALATRRIELMPGARVVGDLRAPLLVIADGCSVEGSLHSGAQPATERPHPASYPGS